MNIADKITLCEVGPRDGLQNEACLFSAEEKVELINKMMDAGLRSSRWDPL